MPLSYHIDAAAGLVTIAGDYADAGEWRQLLDALARDPGFRRGLAFVRDLRASLHSVDAQTVIGIMAVVRELWSRLGVRRAAIVTRPRHRHSRDGGAGPGTGRAATHPRLHFV